MGNKFSINKIICLPVVLVISMVMFGGCGHVSKVKEIYEIPPIVEIPSETLHQIEVIELKEAPVDKDEPVTPEIQEPGPELAEYKLSLEECRALTLENNLDLRVELIKPTIQKELVGYEEAKYEATFTGGTSYSKNTSKPEKSIDASNEETVGINLGVNMPLRTGGTLSFSLVDQFKKTDSSVSFNNSFYSSGLSATISQPLLKGAGRRADTYGIRVAQYNSQMTDLRTKIEAIRIISGVDKAYWRLYASRRMLEVQKKRFDLAKATYEETKRFVDVGSKAKIEIIRTRKSMAETLENIIVADNDVREKERGLKRMLNKKGLGMETKTILIPSSPPDPVRYEIDRKSMVKHALENRMEMMEMEIQLVLDNMKIENNRNQLLPDFTFDYTYNINGLGSERSDSYDTLLDRDSNNNRLALNMNIPLGNKRAKSRLRQAVYERAQNLAKKENREAEIKKDVLDKIDKLEATWQRILASKDNTILSDEQYRAEKRQYELGLRNSTELLKSLTDLADAKRAEIAAITDYQIALIDLAQATGTLLGAARVEWAPIVPVGD